MCIFLGLKQKSCHCQLWTHYFFFCQMLLTLYKPPCKWHGYSARVVLSICSCSSPWAADSQPHRVEHFGGSSTWNKLVMSSRLLRATSSSGWLCWWRWIQGELWRADEQLQLTLTQYFNLKRTKNQLIKNPDKQKTYQCGISPFAIPEMSFKGAVSCVNPLNKWVHWWNRRSRWIQGNFSVCPKLLMLSSRSFTTQISAWTLAAVETTEVIK